MATSIDLATYPTAIEVADVDAAHPLATEEYTSALFASVISDGVIHGILNTFQVFADSTGMQVKVRTGRAVKQGFWVNNDSERTLDVATAHVSADRVDSVVLRLDETSPATISLEILSGDPGGDPPDIEDSDIWLGDVLVDNGVSTITSGKITNRRTYAQPGASTTNKTVFRGDNSSPSYFDSAGTIRGFIGLNQAITSSSEDLLIYAHTGDIKFWPGGTESVIFPTTSTDVSISVQEGDIDMASGGLIRFTSAATTAGATAGGGASVPGTVAGFLKVIINGAERKIPFFAV
jgi:hypothetical protein